MTAQPDDAPRGFVPKAELYKALAEIDRLRDELAELKEARAAIANDARVGALRRRLKIGSQPAVVLVCLLDTPSGVMAYANELRAALNCPSSAQVNVVLWRVRQVVREAGGPVNAVAGKRGPYGGFWLTDEGRAWLAERVPEVFAKGAAR